MIGQSVYTNIYNDCGGAPTLYSIKSVYSVTQSIFVMTY